MADGLRIMIYDDTDRKTVFRQLKEMTPPELDPLDEAIDKLDLELGMTHSWWAGGWLFRKLRRFDHTKGFDSWEAALRWIADLEPDKNIAEIQFWGHGSPGKAWINGQALHHRSYVGNHYGPLLKRIKARLMPDSLIWFRTCSTFAAARGHRFAEAFSQDMGCTIAAHTHIIGLFQSGLHTIKPGEKPDWQLVEGIDRGSVDNPKKMIWSGPFKPKTIFCLRSTIPEGW